MHSGREHGVVSQQEDDGAQQEVGQGQGDGRQEEERRQGGTISVFPGSEMKHHSYNGTDVSVAPANLRPTKRKLIQEENIKTLINNFARHNKVH